MKKASQLDWVDLQEIAKMKGVSCMLSPSDAAPVHDGSTSNETEHAAGSVGVASVVAEGSQGVSSSTETSVHGLHSSGDEPSEPMDP